MDGPGQKLRRVRERLNLRFRDVEEASIRLADRYRNDEFILGLSRLSDIENKGTVPSIYRLYSLCAIYRLDPREVMRWYGVDTDQLPSDAGVIKQEKTHLLSFPNDTHLDVRLPLTLDPGIDLKRTTFLSRMIQRWGRLPLILLEKLDLEAHRYGYIGADDWFMYPLLQPGSLVLIDDSKNTIHSSGWTSEFDRPIYFLQHRSGFYCAWCLPTDQGTILLQPHSASQQSPIFLDAATTDVLGQVVGVAMRLDTPRKRRSRSS